MSRARQGAHPRGADPDAVGLLSRDRLEGFRNAAADSDKELVSRYLLNAAVSEALHPHLHAVEVILRNRVVGAGTLRFPVDPAQPGTYGRFPVWLDAEPGILAPRHRQIVDQASEQVAKSLRRRYGPKRGAALRFRTPGRLVAALPFSFWVFLFDPGYSGDHESRGLLWPDSLPEVFPHGAQAGIGRIRSRLRRLLVVRNRIMHYERIFPYADGKGFAVDPDDLRDQICELVGWMSPRAESVLRRFDRIPEDLHPTNRRFLRWVPWRF